MTSQSGWTGSGRQNRPPIRAALWPEFRCCFGLIESLGGPIIAMILFIMPMYAIRNVPAMKRYQGRFSNVFVTVMGLIAISAVVYGLL